MAKRNWWAIIDDAVVNLQAGVESMDVFTQEDQKAAGEWPDCACGVQSRAIPRYTQKEEEEVYDNSLIPDFSAGQPKDYDLYEFGCEFADAVSIGEPYRAAYLLAKIENRSAQILADQARKAARRERDKARKAAKKGKK